MTIGMLAEEYLSYLRDNLGRSPLTIVNYGANLNTFIHHLGDRDINKITLEEIIRYGQYLRERKINGKKYADVSISTSMRVVRLFYAWVQDIKGIEAINPKLIPVPHHNSARVKYLTVDEFHKIVGCLNCRRFADLRMRAMLEVYLSTGVRMSGVLNLSRADVDLERGEVTIRKKGGGWMTAYLNDRSILWINKYLARRNDELEYMWVSNDGHKPVHKLRYNTVEQQVYRLRERANIGSYWTLHTLRHTFATRLLQNGANIRQVQELLGHKSLSSTMVYTNFTNLDLREAHHKYLKI